MCAKLSQALLDHVLLVLLRQAGLAHLEQLDHPTWVKIHHEADSASILGQVLDRQPETPRPGGSKGKPISALREKFVGQRIAESLIIKTKIFDVYARLGNAGATAG